MWAKENKWTLTPKGTKVIVRAWIYWEKYNRDSDNIWKLTLDSFQGVLVENDRWFVPRVMDFTVDKEEPRLELEFEVMG